MNTALPVSTWLRVRVRDRFRVSSPNPNQELIANEGIMALYKGVGPRMTRVCCEVAITMTLYGEVVKLLDSVWDTSSPSKTEMDKRIARAGSTLIEVETGTKK